MQNSYNVLYEKYQKCISSSGANYQVGSFDFNRYFQQDFNTNDFLEFELISASIFIKIKRISKIGPVIEINGCEFYITENGVNSTNDGIHAFYLPLKSSFYIKYSAKSCIEGNASITEDDVEIIELSVVGYNVDEQKTTLKYKRDLYKK